MCADSIKTYVFTLNEIKQISSLATSRLPKKSLSANSGVGSESPSQSEVVGPKRGKSSHDRACNHPQSRIVTLYETKKKTIRK